MTGQPAAGRSITGRVHALHIPFRIPAGPGIMVERSVTVHLVLGDGICLIDSGVAGSEAAIAAYLGTLGRDMGEISLLVLTHAHPDHMGAAAVIREATGCTVAAHPLEIPWIEDPDRQNRERPVPGFSGLVAGPVRADHPLSDGDIFEVPGYGPLEVLHTPGHSPGSISLHARDEGLLFTGDAVPVPGEAPIYDDPLASIRSIRWLKAIPDLRFLLPAWDEPREGAGAYHALEEGMRLIGRVHGAVKRICRDTPGIGTPDLTGAVLRELGIPVATVNPLVARTVEAHRRIVSGSFKIKV